MGDDARWCGESVIMPMYDPISRIGYDSPVLAIMGRPFPLPVPPSTDREPRLYFCVGAARSGKSTLARKWVRREASLAGEKDDGFPRFMWDSDLLRLELYGERHRRCGEPMVYAIKNYAVRTALASPSDVVVAGTHSSMASIRRILEIRRDAIPVLVDTPQEICIERAIETGQPDLIPCIERISSRIETIKAFGLGRYIQAILNDMDSKVPY